MSVKSPNRVRHKRERGLTLVELVVTVAILAILASAAVPISIFKVKRERERELRRDLWEMRDAIDHYKDAADRGAPTFSRRASAAPNSSAARTAWPPFHVPTAAANPSKHSASEALSPNS